MVFVRNIDKKAYTITVKEGELFAKNSTANIYKNQPTTFSADPKTCEAASSGGTGTATSAGSALPLSTPIGATEIAIASDKTTAKKGDKITVTAIVSNRKGGSLDWVQTTGQPISTPEIKNEDTEGGKTKSVFAFTMPDSNDPITLKLTVGSVSQNIAIGTEFAPTATPSVDDTSQDTAKNASATDTAKESLAERLRKRREAMQASAAAAETALTAGSAETGLTVETSPIAEPENVHQAAGELAPSGPTETALIAALISMGMIFILRKKPSLGTS
jgi:hypothetical protein